MENSRKSLTREICAFRDAGGRPASHTLKEKAAHFE